MDNDIRFQIIDWRFHEDEYCDLEAGQFLESEKRYKIDLYGRTSDDKTIYVSVDGFSPYFYVEIPSIWNSTKIEKFVDTIKEQVYYKLKNSLLKFKKVEKHKFEGFTNYKKFSFIKLIFKNLEGFRAYQRVLNKPIKNFALSKIPTKYKQYESNIEPFIRCMHMKDLQACGWVLLKKGKYNEMTEKYTISNYNVECMWENLEPIKSNDISKIVIASFDIECTSGDGSFPQAERDADQIIQIGTTFNRYGEDECFYKHIITLGTCANIPDVDVEYRQNEKDVLIGWANMIRRMNPDVMTGYNIFGFDYKYLCNRSKKLGCYQKFSKLCRNTNGITKFVEKQLSSSALGDNMLSYYDMTGRIQIDLMKVIQKDFKLQSYKLDYVASYFIREDIISVQIADSSSIEIDQDSSENYNGVISTIYTKSTYGLKNGQYISIYYNDGLSDNKYKDGKKFKIISLENNKIVVKGRLDGEEMDSKLFQSYWCQAKDDITPNDIFRLQKGNAKDRALVAKYCIQDCVLCNKLLAKLDILTNNIGMANVCHVPLSYLFLRGQGVKIFSLVSKKCRIENHLIPVIKKKYKPPENDKAKDNGTEKQLTKIEQEMKKMGFDVGEEEEEDEGYEGATVFPPEVGVHFQPIPVLDYASLYPRSMIHRNLSTECQVLDEIYDNLKGYVYRNVTYKKSNGDSITCRYAQKENGEMGIIPKILNDLLDARTNTKNEMKNAKDEFKESILNGLQLAYKITANSLYGQLGAPTSPIYCKDIAASTTATGRDMLTYAKEFNECIFPYMVELIQKKKFKTFRKEMYRLIDGKIIEFNISPEFKELLTVSPDLIVKVNEDRFINKKLGHTGKDDFITYFKNQIIDILGDFKIKPKVIYGDTDSVFIRFGMYDPKTGKDQTDHNALAKAIKLGVLCGLVINKFMPYPHDLEYEKTFWPFTILTKKRYVGNLYEFNPDKYEQKSMGIVLKRRDNAQVVKIVCGGIVRSILIDKSIEKAIEFTKQSLYNILAGKYSMDKFVITKTLRSEYADRTRIVHAVLADRMSARDPGNKPQSNDRIPYAYIETKNEVKLQGDRVEHPEYIIKNNLHLDYMFYITNQIMKPAIQFLALLVKDPKTIFNEFLIMEENRRKGKRPIDYIFNNAKCTSNGISIDDDIFGDNESKSKSRLKSRLKSKSK